MLKCGDIVLAEYPFTDNSGSKVRPVLVVSSDEHNTTNDVVVVPISSAVREGDFLVSENTSAFSGTGLRHTSSIKWYKPMTLADRVLRRRTGRIEDKLLKEIHAKLHAMLSTG
jgi:mRNA interferase MazF